MNHIKKIAAQLESDHQKLDGILITSAANEYYAMGFHGEGYVLITRDFCHYTTDSRYIEAAQNIRKEIEAAGNPDAFGSQDKAASDTDLPLKISMICPGQGHIEQAVSFARSKGLLRVGFEEETMTVSEYNRIRAAFPEKVELIPSSTLLTGLRSSKDPEELELIQKAQDITDRAFTEILNDLRPGVTEKEIAARLTYLQMKLGASGNSFDPIAASGANGSMPHAVPTDKPLAEGEFITMDFGAVFQGYCSDMTRTVCIGTPSDEMQLVYDTVLKAQKAGMDLACAQATGAQVHEAAHEVIRQAGYGQYFGHGFGHSLGIEIHEAPTASPRNKEKMPVGAVVSAEPGIYLPGRFGVRIEDITYYRETDCVSLTHSPKELICL